MSERFRALDGLRGFAAVVVLVSHLMLVSPALAAAYGGSVQPATWVRVLADSPLHLFWAGREAVFVFFVLSGFVLARPFLVRPQTSWLAYYPKRILRLYLPVGAAVVLAVALFFTIGRDGDATGSWWVNDRGTSFAVGYLIKDLVLVHPGYFNAALWSLQWEVAFSLLLPAYVFVARRSGQWGLPLGAAALSATAAGASLIGDNSALVFLPVFALGSLMAANVETLRALGGRVTTGGWCGLSIAAGVGLTASWWMTGSHALSVAVSTAAAALTVYLFLTCPAAIRAGTGRAGTWLGSRSFSLYLVHEPIVVYTAIAASALGTPAVMAIAVVLSFAAADAFYRLVEGPSHRFAQWAGRRVSARTPEAAHAASR